MQADEFNQQNSTDAEAAASLRREPTWMAHRVSVSYEVTSDLRQTGVVGLGRNEVLIELSVRTTTADATLPCEWMP